MPPFACRVPPWYTDVPTACQPTDPNCGPIPYPIDGNPMSSCIDASGGTPFKHTLDGGAFDSQEARGPDRGTSSGAPGTDRGTHSGAPVDSCGAEKKKKSPRKQKGAGTGQRKPTTGRRRRLNSLAQKRYRLKQKKAAESLEGTVQELEQSVPKLQEVTKACASLQVPLPRNFSSTRADNLGHTCTQTATMLLNLSTRVLSLFLRCKKAFCCREK